MLDLDNLSNLDNLLNSDNKNSKSTSLSLDAGSLFGDDVLSELEVVTDDMAKSNSLSKLYTSEKTKLINKINNLTGKYQEKLNSQSLSQLAKISSLIKFLVWGSFCTALRIYLIRFRQMEII